MRSEDLGAAGWASVISTGLPPGVRSAACPGATRQGSPIPEGKEMSEVVA